MKVLLDTTIAVAACVEAHPHHRPAFRILERVWDGTDQGLMSAHSVAETFAVLSVYPIKPRIGPEGAAAAIRKNLLARLRIVSLSGRDYTLIVQRLAEAGLNGGIVYDALTARVAEKEGAQRLWTLNVGDFARLASLFAIDVRAPSPP